MLLRLQARDVVGAAALLPTLFYLLEVWIICHTLVLRKVIEFRDGLLLGLVELIIEFARVQRIPGAVNLDHVGDQMVLAGLRA